MAGELEGIVDAFYALVGVKSAERLIGVAVLCIAVGVDYQPDASEAVVDVEVFFQQVGLVRLITVIAVSAEYLAVRSIDI